MEKETLATVDNDFFTLIMTAHDAALDKFANPNYIFVLPPPDDKTPGSLVYAWGIEMFRAGFEAGFELADKLLNMKGETENDKR